MIPTTDKANLASLTDDATYRRIFRFSHVLLFHPTLSFIRISHQVAMSAHVLVLQGNTIQTHFMCSAQNLRSYPRALDPAR